MAQFHSLLLFCGQINLLTVQTNHFKMRGVEHDSRFVCLPLTRCEKQSSGSSEAGENCYYSCSPSVIIAQCNGELGRKQQRSVSHKQLARVMAPRSVAPPTTSASCRRVWFRNSLSGSTP